MDYSSLSKHTQNLSTRRGEKNGLQGSIWQIAVRRDEGETVKYDRSKKKKKRIIHVRDEALPEIKRQNQ